MNHEQMMECIATLTGGIVALLIIAALIAYLYDEYKGLHPNTYMVYVEYKDGHKFQYLKVAKDKTEAIYDGLNSNERVESVVVKRVKL